VADYTSAELDAALLRAGLASGDVVYCHSNLGFFGQAQDATTRTSLCELVFDRILRIIGSHGVLMVPTYTYSFSNQQTFDPLSSSTKMGLFAEWVRMHPDACRAHDPFYSIAAIGHRPERFCFDLPPNSFAPDSIFDRFYQAGGKVLCLNHPGCTLLHYCERELKVPYRFDKSFQGQMVINGAARTIDWKIWVRYLSDDLLIHDPHPFVTVIKEQGWAHWQRLGRGEVLAIPARSVMQCLQKNLPLHPWLLTAAHAKGIEPTFP
jgi:aminoglycoside 3-N-acetyltransferase